MGIISEALQDFLKSVGYAIRMSDPTKVVMYLTVLEVQMQEEIYFLIIRQIVILVV
jgi:hypothetical protein